MPAFNSDTLIDNSLFLLLVNTVFTAFPDTSIILTKLILESFNFDTTFTTSVTGFGYIVTPKSDFAVISVVPKADVETPVNVTVIFVQVPEFVHGFALPIPTLYKGLAVKLIGVIRVYVSFTTVPLALESPFAHPSASLAPKGPFPPT